MDLIPSFVVFKFVYNRIKTDTNIMNIIQEIEEQFATLITVEQRLAALNLKFQITPDQDKTTLLNFALDRNVNSIRVFDLLVTKENVKISDNQGVQPLQRAVAATVEDDVKLAIIDLLISKDADVNATDIDGFSAMHSAAANSTVAIMEILQVNGGLINVASHDGGTPLACAVRAENADVVKYLLLQPSIKENLNQIVHFEHGETVAHIAANMTNSEVVLALLEESEIDFNIQNLGGVCAIALLMWNKKLGLNCFYSALHHLPMHAFVPLPPRNQIYPQQGEAVYPEQTKCTLLTLLLLQGPYLSSSPTLEKVEVLIERGYAEFEDSSDFELTSAMSVLATYIMDIPHPSILRLWNNLMELKEIRSNLRIDELCHIACMTQGRRLAEMVCEIEDFNHPGWVLVNQRRDCKTFRSLYYLYYMIEFYEGSSGPYSHISKSLKYKLQATAKKSIEQMQSDEEINFIHNLYFVEIERLAKKEKK